LIEEIPIKMEGCIMLKTIQIMIFAIIREPAFIIGLFILAIFLYIGRFNMSRRMRHDLN